MRQTCGLWTLLLCLLFVPAMLAAQTQPASVPAPHTAKAAANPKTPKEFLARARQLSDLEAAGIPFHLKGTYVAAGDAEFTGNGTIEEWWQSKDLWRKEATLGNYRWVRIANGGRPLLYTTSAYVPLRLRQALDAVPIGLPSETSTAGDWRLAHQKLSTVNVIVLSKPYNLGASHPKVKVVEANYFTTEGVLRIHLKGNITTLYNNFQSFQGLLIPRKIDVAFDTNRWVAMTIDLLEKLKQDKQEILLAPSLPQNLLSSKSNFTVVPPELDHPPPVRYPDAAKQNRVQGTVVIGVSIGEDGKVREPYLLSSAGQLLDDAALDAVRKYQFKPATLGGKPISVEMMITTNFSPEE